jgi:hypothetical protein
MLKYEFSLLISEIGASFFFFLMAVAYSTRCPNTTRHHTRPQASESTDGLWTGDDFPSPHMATYIYPRISGPHMRLEARLVYVGRELRVRVDSFKHVIRRFGDSGSPSGGPTPQ